MPDRLVIVVPYSEEQATRDRIVELGALGWERSIQLVGGPARRGPGDSARVEARRVLQIADNFDAASLIVTKEICCDTKTMVGRGDLDLRRPAVGLLRSRIIKHELDAMGLSWRVILRDRLSHWNAKKHDVDDWLGQFSDLGIYWVGEALLRQIDVISPDEVFRAFQMAPQAMIGQNHIFAYISDDDPASSSNRIGGLLAQSYGLSRVKDFDTALTDTQQGSRLVVCEDALWTGVELRDLLDRLAADGDLGQAAKGKRITFRHCVVTDFGLLIVRQYLSYRKLESIDLSLGDGQRFIRLLALDVDDPEIRSRWNMRPAEFEDWLTSHVRPIVFQDAALWRGQHEQAQEICAEIGRQLIDKYMVDGNKNWREEVRDGFALGAGRFGSAMLFGHSVPKVCLPLFWLEGKITIGSGSLNWQPLFYDARRAAKL